MVNNEKRNFEGKGWRISAMNEQQILKRIQLLEYHQKLVIMLLKNPNLEFYKLIIENRITEQETQMFYSLCDKLSKKMEEQKAEGFVYFYPLFDEFLDSLPPNLFIKELIHSCLKQQLYEPLFNEFVKYL